MRERLKRYSHIAIISIKDTRTYGETGHFVEHSGRGEVEKMQLFYNYAALVLAALGALVGLTGYLLTVIFHSSYVWLIWLVVSLTLTIAGYIAGRLIKKLNLSSHTDFLTGLWNRRYFYLKLQEEEIGLTKKKPWRCIAMIDIDKLKEVNDRYGHATGDILLSEVAAILKKNTRKTDIVARWGGDEFAIIFADIALADASEVMERIRCRVEKMFHDSYGFTISVGIIPIDPDQDLRNLLKRADQALYKAKTQKNSVVTVTEAEEIRGM